MKKLSSKERTLQSIKDGFGGDSYGSFSKYI
jgi:hypothetical protein